MTQEQFVPSVAKPTGGGPPVTRFSGLMNSLTDDPPGYRMITKEFSDSRKSKYVEFNFSEVVVIEASAKYPYPVLTLTIPFAPPDQSRGDTFWEAFSESMRLLFPGDVGSVTSLVSKTQEWAMVPCTVRRPTGEKDENGRDLWGPAQAPGWVVLGVEGVTSIEVQPVAGGAPVATITPTAISTSASNSVMEYIADLIDGKSMQQFNMVLFEDPVANSNVSTVIQANLDDQLVPALLLAKMIERQDDGTYRRIK